MADLSKALQRFCNRSLEDAIRQEKIGSAAFDAGIIATPTQKEVGTKQGINAMDDLYLQQLRKEAEKGSTGVVGKRLDEGNRVLMALAKGYSMKITDFSCRAQSRPDIVVTLKNGKRLYVEIKSGQGELVKGLDIYDTINTLEKFGCSESWIVWYYDVRDYKAPYKLEDIDNLPYIFMKKCDLVEALAGYNGEIDTWLRITEKAANLQTVVTSNKKLHFLDDVSYNQSYDWPTARDYGELVEK